MNEVVLSHKNICTTSYVNRSLIPVQFCYVLKEVVGSLNLVPEEKVWLTELKLFNLIGLHERDSHGIEASKKPTFTRLLLIGQWLYLINLSNKDVDNTSVVRVWVFYVRSSSSFPAK